MTHKTANGAISSRTRLTRRCRQGVGRGGRGQQGRVHAVQPGRRGEQRLRSDVVYCTTSRAPQPAAEAAAAGFYHGAGVQHRPAHQQGAKAVPPAPGQLDFPLLGSLAPSIDGGHPLPPWLSNAQGAAGSCGGPLLPPPFPVAAASDEALPLPHGMYVQINGLLKELHHERLTRVLGPGHPQLFDTASGYPLRHLDVGAPPPSELLHQHQQQPTTAHHQ